VPAPERESDFAADIGTRVYWLALAVGLIVGILGSGFHLLVDLIARVRDDLVSGRLDHLHSTPASLAAAAQISGWLGGALPSPWPPALDSVLALRFAATVALVASALAAARWLVRRFTPEAAGSGIQEIEGALLGVRTLRWRRVLPVKLVGGALALVAAGAGAGIAAAFNAPVAGVLFVVEEMRREAPYNFQGYHAVLIACIAATVVTELVAGVGPELRLPMSAPHLAHYPVYVALGVLLGLLGVVLNASVLSALDLFAGWSQRAGWSLVLTLSIALSLLLSLCRHGQPDRRRARGTPALRHVA
jgi:H+/Cl- antiporter ClcA